MEGMINMSVNFSMHLLTKEQLKANYDHDVLVAGGAGDFTNVVHDNYPNIWISPRDWFFDKFLERSLRWGESGIFTREGLLAMLPKARAWVKDPENEIEDDTISYVLASYLELEIELCKFNPDTHVIIGTKC